MCLLNVKKLFLVCLVSFNASCTLGGNDAPSIYDAEKESQSLLSIKDNPGYQHIVQSLQNIIDSEAASVSNHFFIANYTPDQYATYMFWREGRKFWILPVGGSEKGHWSSSIEHPHGGSKLNLDTDVVATQEEIGSSTYLVDQPWINEKLYDSVINGTMITIEKTRK